jgi:hypothetical protein
LKNGDPRVGERVVYVVDVAADEMFHLHVGCGARTPAGECADRDKDVLGDIFD